MGHKIAILINILAIVFQENILILSNVLNHPNKLILTIIALIYIPLGIFFVVLNAKRLKESQNATNRPTSV